MSSIYHDCNFAICELCDGPLQIERAIKFSKCAIWHHDYCTGIQQHALKVVKMHNSLNYLCKRFIVGHFPDLQAQISVSESKFEANSSGIDTKFSALSTKVEKHEKIMQNKLLDRNEPVEEVISHIIQEKMRISDRMLNICVFNMRCTNDDSRSFSALCLQKLSLDKSAVHHCIISVRRMKANNRHNNVGRPGPLIIRFS